MAWLQTESGWMTHWNGINFKLFSNSSACLSVTYHMCALFAAYFFFFFLPIAYKNAILFSFDIAFRLLIWLLETQESIFSRIWSTLRIHFELYFGSSVSRSCVLGWIWFKHKSERRRSAAMLILFFYFFGTILFHLCAICILLPVACRLSPIRINILHLYATLFIFSEFYCVQKMQFAFEDSKPKTRYYIQLI